MPLELEANAARFRPPEGRGVEMLENTAAQTYTRFEPTEHLRAVERPARVDASMLDSDDRLAPARGILLGAAAGCVFWAGLALAGHVAWTWLIR